jgi:hypothetical protein
MPSVHAMFAHLQDLIGTALPACSMLSRLLLACLLFAACNAVYLQVKLQERDEAIGHRQSQILELHTELSQLQRLLKLGPTGAAAALGDSHGSKGDNIWLCGSPGRSSSRPHFSRGSAEDAVAAATDGKVSGHKYGPLPYVQRPLCCC